MKILENISSGYKRIATGIAIVVFLSMMYLALIPGASFAYVYGPNGGVLSGAFVFIKEWPQYNDTTAIDGSYAIDQMPIGDYTFVAAGNDSVAPYIAPINVTEGNNNLPDITLSPAITYYLPFLYQNIANVYQAGVQIQNNGTSNASTETTFYYGNGTKAGNDFNIIESNKLTDRKVYDITGAITQFTGPAVVKSDGPAQVGGYIRTMASDVYSLASSFTDADASTSMYIPFVFNGGGIYDSGIQVFNPGNDTADVTITLYQNGLIANSTTFTIQPKVFKGTRIGDLKPGVQFTGPANISSNRPVVAQGYIRTYGSEYSIAPAISVPVTYVTIPFVFNGGAYTSGIQVFNPGNSPADVTITLYTDGNIANSTTFTLAAKDFKGTRIGDLQPGVQFTGPALITSTQQIVAQAYIRTTASMIYSIAPQVRKPLSIQDIHLTYLKLTSAHNGGVQVFNPNSVNATVNVSLYYANGTFAAKNSFEMKPYGFQGTRLSDFVPSGFTGYSNISSNQSVVGQAYIRTTSSQVYSIEPPVER